MSEVLSEPITDQWTLPRSFLSDDYGTNKQLNDVSLMVVEGTASNIASRLRKVIVDSVAYGRPNFRRIAGLCQSLDRVAK